MVDLKHFRIILTEVKAALKPIENAHIRSVSYFKPQRSNYITKPIKANTGQSERI